MILTIILGIATSFVTEAITWLNKKLTSTTLQGQAAFLLALVVAIIVGVLKVFVLPVIPQAFTTYALTQSAAVFAVSQVTFYWVLKTFGLTVS